MLFRIDPGSPVPLHDQLTTQVRGGIAAGDLAPGERLPAARELAGSLGINMHTVLKSYATLRDEGLLELRRGRGAMVVESTDPNQVELTEAIRHLRQIAAKYGFSDSDLHAAIEQEA